MRVIPKAVMEGIDAGLIRCQEELRDFNLTDAEHIREEVFLLAATTIRAFNPDRVWRRRGQKIYGELATMAVVARLRYSEDSLSRDVAPRIIQGFMAPLAWFLNSWLHE